MTTNRMAPDERPHSALSAPSSSAVAAEPARAATALQALVEAAASSLGPVQVVRRLRRGRWTLTEIYG